MQRYVSIILLSATLTGPALAQDKVWAPAPVPSVGAGDTIQPAARAGQPLANDGSTPFSSIPTGSVAADGATSANTFDGVETPNLSK